MSEIEEIFEPDCSDNEDGDAIIKEMIERRILRDNDEPLPPRKYVEQLDEAEKLIIEAWQ